MKYKPLNDDSLKEIGELSSKFIKNTELKAESYSGPEVIFYCDAVIRNTHPSGLIRSLTCVKDGEEENVFFIFDKKEKVIINDKIGLRITCLDIEEKLGAGPGQCKITYS